jgi:hypothetical protein
MDDLAEIAEDGGQMLVYESHVTVTGEAKQTAYESCPMIVVNHQTKPSSLRRTAADRTHTTLRDQHRFVLGFRERKEPAQVVGSIVDPSLLSVTLLRLPSRGDLTCFTAEEATPCARPLPMNVELVDRL